MRVVILGATGNVGTSVVRAVRNDKSVDHVIGLARRPPNGALLGIEWRATDIARDDLTDHFQGADAVIHLAWLTQPARNESFLHQVNVAGSARVFEAVAKAGVGTLLYASSWAAYSPAATGNRVDEDWPTEGIRTSVYSRQKVEVERLLDQFETEHHFVRVVRLRPGLVLKAEAAAEIQRLFMGRLLASIAIRSSRLRAVPDISGLAFQVIHSDDLAEAYRLALLGSVTGAYNVACDLAVDGREIADHFALRRVPVNPRLARAVMSMGWQLHIQRTEPGWFDLLVGSPLLDTNRVREELGWQAQQSPLSVIRELAGSMSSQTGFGTASLQPGHGLAGR